MKKKASKPVKKLIPMIAVAIEHEFYFEAVMLISFSMETRLRSIITRVDKSNPGISFTLEQCIRRVKHFVVYEKEPLLLNYFDRVFMDEMKAWKNHRNTALKNIPEFQVSRTRMENLAKTVLNFSPH